jgi:uncharacterized protein YheU (UPF0270 family)
VNKIIEFSEKGENVIIFSNHQTEVDPQVRSSFSSSTFVE